MIIDVPWKSAERMLLENFDGYEPGWVTVEIAVRLLKKCGNYQFRVISHDRVGVSLEFDDPQHALLFRLKYL